MTVEELLIQIKFELEQQGLKVTEDDLRSLLKAADDGSKSIQNFQNAVRDTTSETQKQAQAFAANAKMVENFTAAATASEKKLDQAFAQVEKNVSAVEDSFQKAGIGVENYGEKTEDATKKNEALSLTTLRQQRYFDNQRNAVLRNALAFSGLNQALGGMPAELMQVQNQVENLQFAMFRMERSTNFLNEGLGNLKTTIGKAGAAGLVFATAMASWKIGTAIGEVTGLNDVQGLLNNGLENAIHKLNVYATAVDYVDSKLREMSGVTEVQIARQEKMNFVLKDKMLEIFKDNLHAVNLILHANTEELLAFVAGYTKAATAINTANFMIEKSRQVLADAQIANRAEEYLIGKTPKQIEKIKQIENDMAATHRSNAETMAILYKNTKLAGWAYDNLAKATERQKETEDALAAAHRAVVNETFSIAKSSDTATQSFYNQLRPLDALVQKYNELSGVDASDFVTVYWKQLLEADKQQKANTISIDALRESYERYASTLAEIVPKVSGNIDIMNRPNIPNPKGGTSSVLSMSFKEESSGLEVLIPMVNDLTNSIMTQDEAIQHYYETGKHLGKFLNPEDANRYAEALHKQQEALGELRDGMKATAEQTKLVQMAQEIYEQKVRTGLAAMVADWRVLLAELIASGKITPFEGVQATIAKLPEAFDLLGSAAASANPILMQVVGAINQFTEAQRQAASEVSLREAVGEMPVQFKALAISVGLANPAFAEFIEALLNISGAGTKSVDIMSQLANEIEKATDPINILRAAIGNLKDVAIEQSIRATNEAMKIQINLLKILHPEWAQWIDDMLKAAGAAAGVSQELGFMDKVFGALEIAAGTWGGTMGGVLNSVVSGFKQFKASQKELGTVGATFAGIGQAAIQMGQAIGGTAGEVVSAIGSIVMAAATLGPVGAVVAGVTAAFGFLIKMFQHDWAADVKKTLKEVGLTISEELTKRIAELGKEMKNSGLAVIMSIRDIADEVGITTDNFHNFYLLAHDIFSYLERGQIDAAQAAELFGSVFDDMLAAATNDLGQVNDEFKTLIQLTENFGVEMEEIQEWMDNEFKRAIDAVGVNLTAWNDKMMTWKDNLLDWTRKQLEGNDDLLAQFDRMIQSGATLSEIWQEFSELGMDAEMFEKFSKRMIRSQKEFRHYENEILMWYNALIEKGYTTSEAMAMIGPQIQMLADLAEQFGFSMSAAFQQVVNTQQFASKWGPIVDGVIAQLTAMDNLNMLTSKNFKTILRDAKALFKTVMEDGRISKKEWAEIGPLLGLIVQLAEKYGFQIDKNTRAIIDQARKQKLLPKEVTVEQNVQFNRMLAKELHIAKMFVGKSNAISAQGLTQPLTFSGETHLIAHANETLLPAPEYAKRGGNVTYGSGAGGNVISKQPIVLQVGKRKIAELLLEIMNDGTLNTLKTA